MFPIYHFADFSLFIVSGIIIMGAASAFAFVRPYSQSLFTFLTNFLLYNFKGKQYIWKRSGPQYKKEDKIKEDKGEILVIKKGFPEEQVNELARILDTEGNVTNASASEKLFYAGKEDSKKQITEDEEENLATKTYELGYTPVSSDIKRARMRNLERKNIMSKSKDEKDAELELLGLEDENML